MASGRNWMVYIGLAIVIVLVAFFVWQQVQPPRQVSSVPADAGSSGGAAAAVADAGLSAVPKPGRIDPQEYQNAFGGGSNQHILIDVRTPGEYQSGHIEGAVNIPVQELQQRISEIPQDEPVVVYCRSGNRSSTAAGLLNQAGYDQVYDLGGVVDWQAQGLPLQ